MNVVQSRDPVKVSCPSCGSEILIEDGTKEFVTCSYCRQVHQISDLLKESDAQQIRRMQLARDLYPLRNITGREQAAAPEEPEKAPETAFNDTAQGKLLRCVILCLSVMIGVSALCGLLKALIPLGLSLGCCLICRHMAQGNTEVKNPKASKLLLGLAALFFAMIFFV